MLVYDTSLYEKGYGSIAGVDEAGRGPLAGPVVAAAVILPRNIKIEGINDSKKLSEGRRNSLYEKIQRVCIGCGIGIVSEEIIDEINILRASLEAMRLAITQMPSKPDHIIVDGIYLPTVNLSMEALPHGDSLSQSIAAASIIAKVTRDRIMQEFHEIYPQYNFAQNKGYPTAYHLNALRKFGPCKIHRKSFAPVMQGPIQP